MKRIAKALAGTTLALSLLGGSAAMAAPAHRDSGSNNGAIIAAGIGLVALTAILASSQNDNHGRLSVYSDNDRRYSHSYNNRGYNNRSYNRGYYRSHRDHDRGYKFDRNRRW